jgi:hypothetical protein
MSDYKIIRKGDKISFRNIKPYHKKLIRENPLLKNKIKDDDQFILILFRIADMERSHKMKNKLYYNPYTEDITEYNDVLDFSRLIEWNCAICTKNILSEISKFNIENFVCKKCKGAHNTTNERMDPRIVESSFLFHRQCRDILLKEQRRFLKYIKHFELGYKKGKK